MAKELEKVINKDANELVSTKIGLEKEMQILEKCMEDMIAVYKLNEEKLLFNTKVLAAKAESNKKAINNYTKRERVTIAKYRDEKQAFDIARKQFLAENKKYTKQFKKETKLYQDLQRQFERFEKQDNTREKEIWSMNEAEAKELVEKIMNADKVIHFQ